MEKMNILLLGVGQDQLPMIKKALELKLGVYGLDGNPNAVGKEFLDGFEQVNIKDPEKCLEAALSLNKKVGIDGCMAPAVEVGESVGRIVDNLGIVGISEKEAHILTDKVIRNSFFNKHNFLIPRWSTLTRSWDIYPCIIKPRDKCAAQGVKYIENAEQLKKEEFDLVQEYLDGWELSTEVLVFDQYRYVWINADRNYDRKLQWKPAVLEDGCQLFSKIPQRINKKIGQIIDRIIRTLNLKNCAIKLDLLVKDNLVYIIECAPRLGGGKLSSEMIPRAYGIDWWKLALKLAMGLPILEEELRTPKNFIKKFVAQRYHFKPNPTSHRDRDYDVIEEGETYGEAIAKATARLGEPNPAVS